MVATKLKEISENLGWNFSEGDAYQQNLADLPDETEKPYEQMPKYLMLYEFNESSEKNAFGGLLYTNYDCMLFFSIRSIFNEPEGYHRTEKYIDKLRAEFNDLLNYFNLCDEWEIEMKSSNNKLNQLDTNLDGIMVSCIIKYNHNYDSLV